MRSQRRNVSVEMPVRPLTCGIAVVLSFVVCQIQIQVLQP